MNNLYWIVVCAVIAIGWILMREGGQIRDVLHLHMRSQEAEAAKRATLFLEQMEMQSNLLRRLVERAEEPLYKRALREIDEEYSAGQIDGESHWRRTSYLVEQKEKRDALGRGK